MKQAETVVLRHRLRSLAHYQPQASELSTQPDFSSNQLKGGVEQPGKVSEEVPSYFELSYLLEHELSYMEITPIK